MIRLTCLAALLIASAAVADVTPGLFSDFESETTEGWDGGSNPVNVPTGGPEGEGDAYLRINDGFRFAVFNTNLSGVLDPTITSIQVDLNAPVGQPSLDLRVVLFGPTEQDRWTSSLPTSIDSNGEWDTYTFSLLEEDLTQVLGTASYQDTVGDLDRIMFRHDPDSPSCCGEAPFPGALGLDNIVLLANEPGVPGDANGDGAVDLLDLDILGANFGATDATVSEGDFNDDGTVDLLDLDILGANFGAEGVSTPEPTAVGLLLLGLLGPLKRVR